MQKAETCQLADHNHHGDSIAATGNAIRAITYPKVIDKEHGRGALGKAEGKASTIKARQVGTEAKATGKSAAGVQENKYPSQEFGLQLGREIFALVSTLIANGYNIEQKFQGWSPLMKAAEENEARILQKLLQQKAKMDVKNQKGRTALSFAASPSMKRNTACDTLRLLLENNADPSQKDDRGLTPKAHAIRERRWDAMKRLDQFGH